MSISNQDMKYVHLSLRIFIASKRLGRFNVTWYVLSKTQLRRTRSHYRACLNLISNESNKAYSVAILQYLRGLTKFGPVITEQLLGPYI